MRTTQFAKMFRRATAAFVFLLTIAFTSFAVAQLSGKGSIRGTVLDQTGAVVPNASVIATNKGTNARTVRETTSSGDYELSSLDPGDYTVTVSAQGFEGYTQQNVHVNALDVANLNIKLTIGASNETVTVTEAPPALETTNATLGATMEQAMYASLPLEMGAFGQPGQRRATDFATLMPGVQGNETTNNATTNAGVVNGSGSRGAVSAIYINGIPFTSTQGMGDPRFMWSAISVEAVDQFQIQTTGYPALYEGQGVQNYSIKSGTNTYHGSVYDFIRNTAFDTWGFFAPAFNNPYAGHPTKPTEHQNEYGIVLSGPIIHNKLFYFGNYSGYRYTVGPKPVYQTQPTMAMRGLNGTAADFSAAGVNIYDPRSTVCNAGATICTRSQFGPSDPVAPSSAANVIPASLLSTAAKNIQSFIPANTNANLTNNYLAGYKWGLSNWSTTHRLDYNIGSKNVLSLIVAQGRQASTVPVGQSTTGRNLGPIPINFGQAYAPKTTVIVLQDAYTITPHIVNQFNYGFARYNSTTFNTDRGSAYGASTLGISGLPAGQAQDAFPAVTFSGTDAPTTLANEPGSKLVANAYIAVDNVQWIVRNHLITIGGQIDWLQYENTPYSTGTSPLTLANAVTETSNFNANASTTITTTGLAYASFLTGAVDKQSLTQNSVVETGGRFRPISPYIQDTWRATKKLTIDAGLRWDYFPSYREAHDRMSFLNPTAINPTTGNLGALEFAGSAAGAASCNCHTNINKHLGNFGPRLGVAYSLDSKTVVRASYGVMFTHGNAVGGGNGSKTGTGTLGLSANPANSFVQTITGGSPSTQFLDAGFQAYTAPPFLNAGYGTGFYTGVTTAQGITYGDPYLGSRAPEYVNWSFGFQRQLTSTIVASVTYVGSEGHFVQEDTVNGRGQYINQLNPVFLAAGATLSSKATPTNINTALTAAGVAVGQTNYYSTFDQTQTVAKALLAFPQYSSVSDIDGNYANTNYNALQIVVNKRTTHGLTFMGHYTYSKAIDDGGAFRSGWDIPAAYTANHQVWDHMRIERSESTSSQRQHAVLTGVYALPFGSGRLGGGNAYTRSILSGFNFSGIFQANSGSPLPITASSCGTNASSGTCLPSMNPAFTGRARINGSWGQGVTAADVSKRFIDPNAFILTPSTAAAPLYSNAPRTAPYKIFGPGNYDLDLSLRRIFALHAFNSKLTIQADLYNVTNHTQFLVSTGSNSSTYYQGATSPGAFGQVISQANLPRQAQFSARIEF